MNIEAPSNHNNQPSSVKVLADFEQRRENLAPYIEELEKPGFKHSAEAKIYQKDVETFNKEWSNYGGEAIDAAQASVDELNFKSTPEERIAANTALTEARSAFYENYLAQNEAADTPDEEPVPTIEETPAPIEQSSASPFAINDIVTVGRNAYDENGTIDRSKPQTLESGWMIESQNADGTYHVILEEGTMHDGQSGRLSKDVTAEDLAAWSKESKDKEKTPDAKQAIANFLNAWNAKKYQGEDVGEPVELYPQTEKVEKIPVVSIDTPPRNVIVQEVGHSALASVAKFDDDHYAERMAREKGPSLKEKAASGIDTIKGFLERRAEARTSKKERRAAKKELRARARRIRQARETQERQFAADYDEATAINDHMIEVDNAHAEAIEMDKSFDIMQEAHEMNEQFDEAKSQEEREAAREARIAEILKKAAERKAKGDAKVAKAIEKADRKAIKIDARTQKEIDGDESSVKTFLRRVGHIVMLEDGNRYR